MSYPVREGSTSKASGDGNAAMHAEDSIEQEKSCRTSNGDQDTCIDHVDDGLSGWRRNFHVLRRFWATRTGGQFEALIIFSLFTLFVVHVVLAPELDRYFTSPEFLEVCRQAIGVSS